MQNDELLDLVNDKDEVIGTVYKSEAHSNPDLIHREIALIIFNHKGETLLQQRSSKKKADPLKWVVACSGHVGAGEAPDDAVKRELKEELGITEIDLEFFGKLFSREERHSESKFYWIYYGFYDNDTFTLDKEEVEDVKWVKLNEFAKFYEDLGYSLKEQSYITTMEIAKKISLYDK